MSAPAPTPPTDTTATSGGPVTIAGVLAIAVNFGFALLGAIGSFLSAAIAFSEPADDHTASNTTAVGFLIVSAIVLVLAIVGIVMARGVLRRRAGGRWVTVTLFSLYGLMSGTFLIAGGLDPTIGAGNALVTGGIPLVFCVAIVALLLTPRAYDDFAARAAADDE